MTFSFAITLFVSRRTFSVATHVTYQLHDAACFRVLDTHIRQAYLGRLGKRVLHRRFLQYLEFYILETQFRRREFSLVTKLTASKLRRTEQRFLVHHVGAEVISEVYRLTSNWLQ